MRVIGIDPGLTGGLSCIDDGKVIGSMAMPLIGKEIDVRAIEEFIELSGAHAIFIEKVHAMPKQGVSSTFTFGMVFGVLIGLVRGMKRPLHFVTPQAWMKETCGKTGGEKDVAAAWCARVHPEAVIVMPRCRKPHEGICDAIGIAHYGHQKLSGNPLL